MALEYGFYDSVNGDRKYNSLDFGRFFDGVITNGVFATYGNAFKVSPASSGMSVTVGTGKAWFNHRWSILDTPLSLSLSSSDPTLMRIDAIVLEINEETRINSFKVIEGTSGNQVEKPQLTNSDTVHQYAIAYITIPAAATSILASNIEYAVGTDKSGTQFISALLKTIDASAFIDSWRDEYQQLLKDTIVTEPSAFTPISDSQIDSMFTI